RALSTLSLNQSGWLYASASPQNAIAKPGSIFCACRNASIASSYSKLCRYRTPRRNTGCAAAAPDVGKEMCPRSAACDEAKDTKAGSTPGAKDTKAVKN